MNLLLIRNFIDCLMMAMMHLSHMTAEPACLVDTARDSSISMSKLFGVHHVRPQHDFRLQCSRALMICI